MQVDKRTIVSVMLKFFKPIDFQVLGTHSTLKSIKKINKKFIC